jgi:nitrite reductase (NADH) large subunit
VYYDHLIIGGGIAGVSAAEAIRQRDPRRTILVLGAEKHPLYSRVLLPHIADGRAKPGRAMLKSPATLAASGIGYESGAEVRSVDAAGKSVTLVRAALRRSRRRTLHGVQDAGRS